MVVALNSFIGAKNIGAKARFLVDVNRFGYRVPRSIAIDTNEYLDAITPIKKGIAILMRKLNFDNIVTISTEIKGLFDQIQLSLEAQDKIFAFITEDDTYIACPSIDSSFSFAGLLPIRKGINKNNVLKSIINCYKELFSYNTLSYIYKNNIDYHTLTMAIILQKEIPIDKYISITTMNPVRLRNSEMTIDIKNEQEFEKYIYDYNISKYLKEDKYQLVSHSLLSKIISLAHKLQNNFGHPLEIELAISSGEIYILQGQKLEHIMFDNYYGILKKLNLVPKAFMYSLFKYNYDNLITTYAFEYDVPTPSTSIQLMFNGVYVNYSFYQSLLDKITNYSTDYFKSLSGVDIIANPKISFKRKREHWVNQRKIEKHIKELMEQTSDWCEKAHKNYNTYCHNMPRMNGASVENYWMKLVFVDYHSLASHYYELSFLINIYKLMVNNRLKNIVSIEEFEDLIAIKEKDLTTKIDKILYDLATKINNDKASYHYWYATPIYRIVDDYEALRTDFYHPEFRSFIDNYGYLSLDENDLSSPCYVEDVEIVIRKIKKILTNFKPYPKMSNNRLLYNEKMQENLLAREYNHICNQIKQLQELQVARSYLKDYVRRFNFLIKRYTKMLAKYYVNKKILSNENDIWHLDINTISKYIDGDIAGDTVYEMSIRQELYHNAYANFVPPIIIGSNHSALISYDYRGIGLSKGIMKGRVKIVKNINDLRNLHQKNILVTKTLSPNILFKISKVGGIIISDEYLSYDLKTLIRDLGIPCIILKGCGKKLKEGNYIKADGNLGYIKIVKQ